MFLLTKLVFLALKMNLKNNYCCTVPAPPPQLTLPAPTTAAQSHALTHAHDLHLRIGGGSSSTPERSASPDLFNVI